VVSLCGDCVPPTFVREKPMNAGIFCKAESSIGKPTAAIDERREFAFRGH